MFKKLGGEDNSKAVPEPLQFLEAEVLRPNTPVELCRLAAGEHQLEQRDVMSLSVADAFAFFVKSSREKKAKFGSPFFSDKEVATLGCQLGLQQYLDRNGHVVSEAQAVCRSYRPEMGLPQAISFATEEQYGATLESHGVLGLLLL